MISYQAARQILFDDPDVPSIVKTMLEALEWRSPLESIYCANIVLEMCKQRAESELNNEGY